MKPCSVTIFWKAAEQYFHVVLFVLSVIQSDSNLKSVDQTIFCDQSRKVLNIPWI